MSDRGAEGPTDVTDATPPAPQGAEPKVTRVAERALLVTFPDHELVSAVRKTHLLVQRLQDEGRDKDKGSIEGKDRDEYQGKDSIEGKGQDQDCRGARRGDASAAALGEDVEEVIPGAGSVLVLVRPAAAADRLRSLRTRLERVALGLSLTESLSSLPFEHRFAVRYGGECGPDLVEVARALRLAPERVVELHAAAVFTVAFLGFSPGFGYLIGLPAELELPRRAAPRARVEAGSVAIAGAFSAVYPSATPGGWHLLGRVESGAPLFDASVAAASGRPALLSAGDRVRFVPSSEAVGS